MEIKEIDQLIRFHKAGLHQYRHYMDPDTQYLEEQTIKALEELKEVTSGTRKGTKDS